MGAFFTNLQVRNAAASAVSKAMGGLSGRGYVSPSKAGWVTVYAEATEDQDARKLCDIAGKLSKTLKTEVFGFLVHDSDVAMYWLYRCGALVDEFNSAPDYFGEKADDLTRARVHGNPDALLPLCVEGTTRAQVEDILHPTDGHPLMAEEILTELAKLLGIDDLRVSLGFKYFDEEGGELLPDVAAFEPIGANTPKKQAQSPAAVVPVSAPPFDTYGLAITMLTQVWGAQFEQQAKVAGMFGGKSEDTARQLREGFDRAARDMLKRSQLPGRPTIEELKTARDAGPEAFAALIAGKNPDQLVDVGISAATVGLEAFLAALLKVGLDPNAPDALGRTALKAAEHHGLNSAIYRLIQSAAEG